MSASPTMFIFVLASIAIAAMPLALLREKYPTPAYFIASGGVLQLLGLAVSTFFGTRIGSSVGEAVSIVLVCTGLVLLFDAHYPARGFLPPALLRNRRVDRSDIVGPVLLAIFVAIMTGAASLGGGYNRPVDSVAAGVSMLLLIPPWIVFRRRYFPMLWTVHRRPEQIVWVFVQQTTVYRQGIAAPLYVTWSADIGLENGIILAHVALKSEAEMIAAEIAALCPTATIGFSDERRAKFFLDPLALRLKPSLSPPH